MRFPDLTQRFTSSFVNALELSVSRGGGSHPSLRDEIRGNGGGTASSRPAASGDVATQAGRIVTRTMRKRDANSVCLQLALALQVQEAQVMCFGAIDDGA